MGGMHYLRVIMLKKLEGMVPVPYPIQNRVNPSLVGGGRKVVAPSFKSSSAVNFDFHDPKPV